jgi:transposase InsO family protein
MHGRRRLSEYGRALIVRRVLEERWSVPSVAEAAGVSRATVYKWLARYRAEGLPGLRDRSSRPHRSPRRLDPELEARILRLRRRRRWGPHRLAAVTGCPRSTCYAVLARSGVARLAWLDRPTGRAVRRYERDQPGELVHVDVKKLGRIPAGGGHRMRGRSTETRRHPVRLGYDFLHVAVDDHSRLAYVEALPDERGDTCALFLLRAAAFYAAHGIAVSAVMTDNAKNYTLARSFHAALAQLGARHLITPPYRPQVNGKAERFHRTMLDEWAYRLLYRSNEARLRLLPAWVHRYNHHRAHTALGGRSPIQRVNNLPGNYT